MGIRRQALLLVALVILPVTAAPAAEEEPVSRRRWPGWSLQWENDAFAAFSGSDEYYTNGIRLTLLRHPNLNPPMVTAFRNAFCARFCPQADDITTFSAGLGQNFYTPEDITEPDPQPLDRPWAGWLYGAGIVQITSSDLKWQHVFEFDVGVIGPAAGARFAQTEVHEIIDDDPPEGWHNQLDNEPAINVMYLYNNRRGSDRADAIGHGGFSLGTLMAYINAGGTVRAGRNISAFPVTPIPATATPTAFGERAKYEYWAFAGVDGRLVGHNSFLDGSLFQDGPKISDREAFVYDLRVGFFVRRRSWSLTYTFFRRSEEFAPPFGRPDGLHDVGSVTISFQPRVQN